LAVVAGAVSAVPPAPAGSAPGIPFHAHFVATETMAPDVACGGFRVHNRGGGNGTGLGKSSWAATACADFLDKPGRLHARDGRAVITSNGGDELYVSYEGDGELPGLSGRIHVSGPFRITGGTGPFRFVHGSGVVTGDGSVDSPEVTVDVDGTLSLSG
jgi:hypothetical protein